MDEHQKEDTQSAATESMQNSGQTPPVGKQVMDVTAPSRQIDVSSDSEQTPVSDTSSEQSPGALDVSVALPIEVAENTETQQENNEPSIAESVPFVKQQEHTDVSTEHIITSINADDTNSSQPEPAVPQEAQSTDATPAGTHEQTPSSHAHAKRSAPVAAIIIAIIVAVGLAGMVVFAYMQNKDSGDIKRSDTPANSQAVVEKPQASVSDVDSTTQEIDSGLQKADDAKDFSATDFSDASLGL